MIISMPKHIDFPLTERQIEGRAKKKNVHPDKIKKYDRYHINMNQYCNWQGFVMHKIKIAYREIVKSKLECIGIKKIKTPLTIAYTLFKGTKARTDKGNFLSIHEKFFLDALVELGYLEDDNDDIIISSVHNPTKYDKDNPRVEIEIKEL